jgi:hypothetical protein
MVHLKPTSFLDWAVQAGRLKVEHPVDTKIPVRGKQKEPNDEMCSSNKRKRNTGHKTILKGNVRSTRRF